MLGLREALVAAAVEWRRAGASARLASQDVLTPLEVGHLHGMSDGLELAADDLAAILDKSAPSLNGDS